MLSTRDYPPLPGSDQCARLSNNTPVSAAWSATRGATQQPNTGHASDSDTFTTGELFADVHVDASQRTLRSHGKRPPPSSESSPSPDKSSQSKQKRNKKKNAKKVATESLDEIQSE